jgi:hypothetical protein
LDICLAQNRVRALSGKAGLSERSIFQLLIAVTEVSSHLFLAGRRSGRLRFVLMRKGARQGLELTAEVDPCGSFALGLPPLERLVDEVDAGFGPDGRILVIVRVWAEPRRPAPEVLPAGPIAAFAKA